MTAQRMIAIVNPRGGTRRGLKILEQVTPVFVKAGWELEVRSPNARAMPEKLPER